MTYTTIRVQIDDHIAHIELNRPDKLNAMNPAFWQEFPQAVRQIDEQASARVIVISGAGKMFSAGMDLNVFLSPNPRLVSGEAGRRNENLRRTVLQLQECFTILENCRIPVLAAVHGGCIGAGINLISACDCRYATEDAYFCIRETKLGMTADVGVLQRLPKIIPEGLAREMAYTARRLPAKEALRSGLVNEVLPDKEALLSHVMGIAKTIANNSPLAVSGSKEMINFARDHSVAASLKYVATWQSGMFQPNEMMKAFQADFQKSDPDFEELWSIEPMFS